MSEQIQEGPGPKPKKRKRIKKIKILAKPSFSTISSAELDNRIYFDCEEEINLEDTALVKSISVEGTAITNAEEFHFEGDVTSTAFYMHDDKEGHIRTSFESLEVGILLSLTITYHDDLLPEPPYGVSFEM